MRGGGARYAALALSLLTPQLSGQSAQQAPPRRYRLDHGPYRILPVQPGDDLRYLVVDGYLEFQSGDLEVRADRAVLVYDRDEYLALRTMLGAEDELPQRGPLPPLSQARILARRRRALVEQRLAQAGVGGERLQIPPGKDRLALIVRAIYAEGNVVFAQQGIRNLRCRKLWISLVSDRGIMEDVEVRLPLGTPFAPSRSSFVLRCPRIVQQGNRLIARDARMSTCDAGQPHFHLRSQRLVVTQLAAVTEFLGQGNALAIGSLPALPLPDYRYYSDQKNWLPIRGLTAGVSDDRGEFVLATFGGRWNDIGQAMVDLLARTDERFRGEWWLRTGWTRKRGAPVEGGLSYDLPDAFRGDIEAFFLNDRGEDRRSVQTRLDGSPIDPGRRFFTRTKNRVSIDRHTRLDLEAFWASDEAVYAEFRDDSLKEDEQPETSLHLRHARDNRLLSVTGRVNLVDFAYTELATLADRFRSERPYLRADLFSQPLFELVEDMPVVLGASLGAGRLRNQFDATSPAKQREASWRADLAVDVRIPYALGPIAVQPFFVSGQTYYSDQPGDTSGEYRQSFEAGALAATRLLRVFDLDSEALSIHDLYHEIRPEVRGFHRFRVDGEPADFFQFDRVDALDELSAIDLVLLQRLQTRRTGAAGESDIEDLVWLDLSQRIFPNSSRDNGGDRLGLFSFELIVSPGQAWLPIPNLRLLFEGERDWNRNDFLTRNVGIAAGPPGGPTVAAEWRSGSDGDGQGSLYAGVSIFRRWSVLGGAIYDFDLDDLRTTTLSLERRDHDWSLVLLLSRDENTGDESVSIRFVPTLGGLLRPYRPRYVGGDPAFGVRNAASF